MKNAKQKQLAYHPEPGRVLIFDVLREHADGTVDLGCEGELVVTYCRVTSEIEIGSATVVKDGMA